MTGKIHLKTVSELLKEAEKLLRPKRISCEADQKLGWLEAEILMAHAIKKERVWITAHSNDSLTPSIEKKFRELVARRMTHEPIAYILGAKDFYGRPFFVNRTTLIPRPDTELMIDVLKEHYKTKDTFTVLDLGTGSGAIAITTALEFPNAKIIASDICKRALKVAEKNARLYSVEHRIKFMHANLLDEQIIQEIVKQSERKGMGRGASGMGRADELVILANLPYLPESDKTKLAKDVTEFEPAKALYSGKDGLDLIRELFTQISERLNVNPNLILAEFDPPQVKTIQKLAKDIFPIETVKIHKDIAKRDRLIEIRI